MQSEIIKHVASRLPQMNKALIKDFSTKCMQDIPKVAEYLIQQSVQTIVQSGVENFSYLNFTQATPDERLALLLRDQVHNQFFNIAKSNRVEYLYHFRLDGQLLQMPIEVPYIRNGCTTTKDVDYYHMFITIDRGGVNYTDTAAILETLRSKLKFERGGMCYIKAEEGPKIFCSQIYGKLHHGTKGRKLPPPALAYILADCGFYKTMCMFKLQHRIKLVNSYTPEEGWLHLRVSQDIYIKIKDCKYDTTMSRVVAGLYDILTYYTDYVFEDLGTIDFFKIALCAFTQAAMIDKGELLGHAKEFMLMNDSVLDPVAKAKHNSVGIKYSNIAELVHYMIVHLDELLISHKIRQLNLLDKELCTTDTLVGKDIENFNRNVYTVLNSPAIHKGSKIEKLMRRRKFGDNIRSSKMYTTETTIYNDNLLYQLLSRRMSSYGTQTSGRGSSKNEFTSDAKLLAHPSFPVVFGIFTFPASSPCYAGTINPFIQITKEGSFITPDWYPAIEHCFD